MARIEAAGWLVIEAGSDGQSARQWEGAAIRAKLFPLNTGSLVRLQAIPDSNGRRRQPKLARLQMGLLIPEPGGGRWSLMSDHAGDENR